MFPRLENWRRITWVDEITGVAFKAASQRLDIMDDEYERSIQKLVFESLWIAFKIVRTCECDKKFITFK